MLDLAEENNSLLVPVAGCVVQLLAVEVLAEPPVPPPQLIPYPSVTCPLQASLASACGTGYLPHSGRTKDPPEGLLLLALGLANQTNGQTPLNACQGPT